MDSCPGFHGMALVIHTQGGVSWAQADPGVHADDEVAASPLFLTRYEVVAECPHWPGIHHATLRESPCA